MTKKNQLTAREVEVVLKASRIIREWAEAQPDSYYKDMAESLASEVFSFALDRKCEK